MSDRRYSEPETAVQHFLKEREPEVSSQTQYNQRGHLRQFLNFCEDTSITDLTELDGFLLRKFKVYLRSEREVKETTLRNYVSTTRTFVRWCEKVELVEQGLAEKMDYPHISAEEKSRDTSIPPEAVETILDYLYKFEYGTLRHALFQLLWHTAFRLGTVRALDLRDFHPDRQFLTVRHRPETDTPLKNGKAAEREVNINGELCDVLNDYVEYHRPDVTDEHGREPLFATESGRAYDTVLRRHITALTRPCHYAGHCPHGRDENECEAAYYDQSSKCPSSISPHPVRRSAITYHLNQDWPTEKVSERANVSVDVLDKHYDVRTAEEKRRSRRKFLDQL